MKNIHLSFTTVTLSLIIFFVSSCTHQAQCPKIDISGPWNLIEKNISTAVLENYDETDGSQITLPGNWDHILKDNSSMEKTIVLRKKISLTRQFQGKDLFLYLGNIAIADTLYINGKKTASTGFSSSSACVTEFPYLKERIYKIPKTALMDKEEMTIALKVYSQVISGIHGEMYLSHSPPDNPVTALIHNLSIFVTSGLLVLNIVLFLLFASLMLFENKNRVILHAFFLLICVTLLHLLLLDIPSMEGHSRYRLILFAFITAYYFFMMGVHEFFPVKNIFFVYGGTVLQGIFALLLFFSPNMKFMYTFGGIFSLICIIFYVTYSFGIFSLSLYRDPFKFWYFLIAAVPFLVSTIYTIIIVYMKGPAHVRRYYLLYLPASFLGVMIYQLIDLKSSKRKNEDIAKTYLKKNYRLNAKIKKLTGESASPAPKEKINDVIEYLNENYNETYDRIALAKKFDLNEDYMGQVFKKTTGHNISAYINLRRIDAVKELLLETDSKVIDIAYHVGFDNLTHFYRLFKKHAGLTPNDYRKKLPNNNYEN